MSTTRQQDKKPLRPRLPVEVAIYAVACLVEDAQALKARAEQVLASLQALRRDNHEK
jgi:hypothetical protein